MIAQREADVRIESLTPQALSPNQSATTVALRGLTRSARRDLGITDSVIVLVELLIVSVRKLIDEDDPRTWLEKLEDAAPLLEGLGQNGIQELEVFAARLPKDWPKIINSKRAQTFFRRRLGSAAYSRLERAIKSDGQLLAAGMRKLLQVSMPIASSLDSCFSILPPRELEKQLESLDSLGHSLLRYLYIFDRAIGWIAKNDFAVPRPPSFPLEFEVEADLEKFAEEIRSLVSHRSEAEIREVSEVLARKMRGAKQVLDVSDDGVCQASTSLIELIDRLLRQSFSQEYVLQWLETNYPLSSWDLTYIKDGYPRPTKHGEALCFVNGGRPILAGASTLHELAAQSLRIARRELQQLKHSDSGANAEKDEVRQLAAAVEGFFLFSIKVGWSFMDTAGRDKLKAAISS